MKSRAGFWAGLALAACWGLAFALACRLADASAAPGAGDSMLDRLLGSTRVAFGQSLYLTADDFFHMGVKHPQKRAFTDFITRWQQAIAPEAHLHTEGASIYELMPWLRFATEMDPHNVEAYLTTAFWLAGEGARPDLAMQALSEGQRNNPGDYRFPMEKGRLCVREQKDRQAAADFDLGLRLWPGNHDRSDVQTRLDAAQMLTFRAFLDEVAGDPSNALVRFRSAQRLFPQNAALADRIRALESGEDTTPWARSAWNEVFPLKHTCGREDHDHEGEDDRGAEGP